MKTPKLFLTTAAVLACGLTSLLHAQDTPPPPAPPEGGPPPAPREGGDPQGGMDAYLKSVDTDGDGTISKEEFLKQDAKNADTRFARIDTDKDGKIDKAELEANALRLRRPGGERPGGDRPEGERRRGGEGSEGGGMRRGGGGFGMGDMLRRLDANEDKSISKEEFMADTERRFGEIDADKDGKISEQEVEAYGTRLRESFQQRGERGEGGRGEGGGRREGGRGEGGRGGPGGERPAPTAPSGGNGI